MYGVALFPVNFKTTPIYRVALFFFSSKTTPHIKMDFLKIIYGFSENNSKKSNLRFPVEFRTFLPWLSRTGSVPVCLAAVRLLSDDPIFSKD